jgi:phosphate transport system substrate-binding protein
MVDLPLSLNAELAMSNAHLVEMVASDPTALGFTTLQDVPADGQVKTISVGGAPATLAAARNREYRLVAAIMFVAREEPTGASRAFLEWVLSSEGQAVVRRQHLGLND